MIIQNLIYSQISNPPRSTDLAGFHTKPLKFGCLGAAKITPAALVNPSHTHPDVYLYAIAARDKVRAEAFATKYGFQKAYGGPTGYQGRDSAIYLSLLQLLNVLQT